MVTTAQGDYALRFLDLNRVPVAELAVEADDPRDGMTVQEAAREINQPADMAYGFPLLDRRMRQFRNGGWLGKTVQLWRGNQCLWWGPWTAARVDAEQGVVSCRAQTPLWYFGGLNFGPILHNYLTNPNFSTGDLTGWTAVGVTASFDPTRVIRTSPGGIAGTARLVQASAGVDTYLDQVVTFTTGSLAITFTLAGWYCVDGSVPFLGPALQERGLYLAHVAGATLDPPFPNPNIGSGRISNLASGRGTFQRRSTYVTIPASSTENLDVRLYAIGGAMNWGGLSLTIQESVGPAPGVTQDVTTILADMLAYAQGSAPSGFTDKVDLGILFSQLSGAANPTTGVLLERHYQSFDLQSIATAIQEFPDLGACDVAVTHDKTNPTQWHFVVYPGQYPAGGKGVARPELALEAVLDPTGRVAPRYLRAWQQDLDIERSANDIVWLGRGSTGSDREFGRDRDIAHLGGIVRQKVASAPADASLDTLTSRATTELNLLAGDVDIPTVAVPGSLAALIDEGDSVPLRVDDGFAYQNTSRRVARWRLQPSTDTLILEFT